MYDVATAGLIEYTEFIAAAKHEQSLKNQEALEIAFFRLDLDNSGDISIEELKKLVGSGVSEEQCKEILSKADFNQDGAFVWVVVVWTVVWALVGCVLLWRIHAGVRTSKSTTEHRHCVNGNQAFATVLMATNG